MKILSIAWKDLQILFKDRGAVFQLILLPLLFIVVFSGALGALGEEEEDPRIPLPVVDLDASPASQALQAGIEDAGGVRLVTYEQGEAQALLEDGELDRILLIPAGFSSGLAAGDPVAVRLINHTNASSEESEAVRLVVAGAASDLALESQMIASLEQMGAMQANAPEDFQIFTTERIVAQARSQFERARVEPLVAVVQTLPAVEGEREEVYGLDEVAVPGAAVLFVFLTAQATARSIYDEKKVGSFRRLLAAPVSKMGLLVGKMLPNLITGLVQIAVIFAFGTMGLRLLGLKPVSLGNDLFALVLVTFLIALCSSALGILIAALARTENQIGGLSSLFLWGMGILGGSIIPLILLERVLGPLPRIVPQYWANRALDNLMIRGLGLGEVLVDIAALAGFTALLFLLGLWRFNFD